jgi:hypothetical protein
VTTAVAPPERRHYARQPAGHVHASIPPRTAFTPIELAARDLTGVGSGLVLVGQLGAGTTLPGGLGNPVSGPGRCRGLGHLGPPSGARGHAAR